MSFTMNIKKEIGSLNYPLLENIAEYHNTKVSLYGKEMPFSCVWCPFSSAIPDSVIVRISHLLGI